MNFKPSLWDDSDPLYAPFQKLIKGKYYKWMPSKKYVEAGYTVKSVNLDGTPGDSLDMERAARCRMLTREMLEWYKDTQESHIIAGTWGWLMQRYLHDEYSPFRETKVTTQNGYRKHLNSMIDKSGK